MIKTFTLILGIVLLGAGLAGAFTGGHDHNFLVFGINMNHNLVHILSGVLAVLTALWSVKAARIYCLAFGSVYGLVTLAGFMNAAPAVTLLNLNTADNFLHLGITAACLFFGVRAKVQ